MSAAIAVSGSSGVPHDGDVVAGGACDDEQVPDEVVVGNPSGGKKTDAHRVGDAACKYPEQPPGGKVLPDGLDGDDGEPAHREIEAHLVDDGAQAACPKQRDASGGKGPDGGEECPPPDAAHCAEHERGVGACDHEKDGRVVEVIEEAFSPAPGQGVREGRGEVEQNHHGGEHCRAERVRLVATLDGRVDEHRAGGQGGNERGAVAYAVGKLLAGGWLMLVPVDGALAHARFPLVEPGRLVSVASGGYSRSYSSRIKEYEINFPSRVFSSRYFLVSFFSPLCEAAREGEPARFSCDMKDGPVMDSGRFFCCREGVCAEFSRGGFRSF